MNTILGWFNVGHEADGLNNSAIAMSNACVFGHDLSLKKIDNLCYSVSTKNKNQSESYVDDDFVAVIVRNNVFINKSAPLKKAVADYKIHGVKALSQIEGSFACVLYERKRKKLILAIDKIGICNLSYTVTSKTIVFASTIDMLLPHPEVKNQISNQSIFNYLHFHIVPAPKTIYENVYKLRAASYVALDSQKNLEEKYYWQPGFQNKSKQSGKALRNELREILKNSVKTCSNDEEEGSFLSGGLDSSTVSGLLQSVNQDMQAFTIGFGEEGYDEVEYARIVAKHFNFNLNEYYVTQQDVLDVIPIVAKNFDEPFGNSSAIPVYYCAKLAKEHGVNYLLAGDGGDELFAGNERYGTQLIYEMYKYIPNNIKQLVIGPITNNTLLNKNIGILRKANSYILEAVKSVPERIDRYSIYNMFPDNEIYTDSFISQINRSEPLSIRQEIFDAPADADVLDRMLFVDWQHTLADNDLRKVNFMCASAGINVSYPMLSNEMLNFSIKIPSKEKIKLRDLRHFYKKSFSNFLPKEVIHKSKHGFGLPFGVWLRTSEDLKQLANESLLSLGEREIFRTSFIEKIQEKHANDHASFYGELIWILMLFEQWMQNHQR